ncbi:MAG TPA: integrase arm-type DNA-binding domain-containing protein [Rhizomicrobium sp.]|jgi:integrase
MPKPDAATPAREPKTLTDAGIAKAKWIASRAEAGPKSKVVMRDGPKSALQLRITPKGAKSFCVYFRPLGNRIGKRGNQLKGKQCRVTLGQYPALSLIEARQQANEIMGAVLKGRDPWAERKQATRHRYSNLFESALVQFIDVLKGEIASWEKAETALKKHVEPKWTGIPLGDITKRQADELITAIVKRGRKGTAREVRKHLHRMFEWAVEAEIVTKNPLHSRKKGSRKNNPLASNTEAGRALDRKELKAVWQAAAGLGYPFGPWFQLLMLTGQRRADWSAAMRSELKPESELEQEDTRTAAGAKGRYVLEIAADRYKSDRAHIVPLVPAAWKIVAGLPKWEGNDYFLFSGRAGKTHISGYSKAKARLDRDALAALRKADPKAVLPPFRVHDLRVTCRTRLTHLGIGEDISEAVLGHAQGFLGKVYNKHDYIAQKRDALTKYAEWLLEVVK